MHKVGEERNAAQHAGTAEVRADEPANTPTSRTGADSTASSQPMSVAVAPRTSTAVSGSALSVTPEPILEMVWPAHSLKKSEWCQTAGRRDRRHQRANPKLDLGDLDPATACRAPACRFPPVRSDNPCATEEITLNLPHAVLESVAMPHVGLVIGTTCPASSIDFYCWPARVDPDDAHLQPERLQGRPQFRGWPPVAPLIQPALSVYGGACDPVAWPQRASVTEGLPRPRENLVCVRDAGMNATTIAAAAMMNASKTPGARAPVEPHTRREERAADAGADRRP